MQALTDSFVQRLHVRVLTVFLLCATAYGMLALRFVYHQAIPHGKDLADRDLKSMSLPARRGDIYDRNDIPLAVSVDGWDVWVRPNLIRKEKCADKIVGPLAAALNLPIPYIESRLAIAKPFAFVKRQVTQDTGARLLKLQLPGVGADPVFLRTYPQGSLAAQVLGRVNTDDKGTAGLEQGLNSDLQGQDGNILYKMDGRNEEIPGTESITREVHNGKDVHLTIDSRIQEVAEEQLSAMVETHHAAAGCTVVMDVQTGEILAMANRPTFNPNIRLESKDMGALLNRVVSYAYEPGSTMKTITASAALAEHAWNKTQTVTCNGSIAIGNRRIRCAVDPPTYGHHGVETLRDILRNSCNVGAATVGMKLGAPKLYDYIQKFGLLDRPHMGLPGAVAYGLTPPDSWAKMHLANVAFGQGIMVTPLQLVTAYAAVANRGILMKPHIVRMMLDPDTNRTRVLFPEPVRRVIPSSVALDVTDMLEAVVYDGTGKTAEIPGYSVAGKTGSAQKAGGHGYLEGKYVASFVGFAPASHPRVVCLTMIDEPQGVHWGAVLGAPVVREVLRWSLHYLQTPPDAPELAADGGDFKTVRKQESLHGALPGCRGWIENHPHPVLPPDAPSEDSALNSTKAAPIPGAAPAGSKVAPASGGTPPPLRSAPGGPLDPGTHRGYKTV